MEIRVLLVDDETEFVDILGERLQKRGFHVSKAYDGDGALSKLNEEHPDVVILDVLMPGKDGIEVLRGIKNVNPLVEVIMLTGNGTMKSAVAGLRLGAYDYLMKPMESSDLIGKILKAFARKSEHEERIRRAEANEMIASGDM